MQFVKIEGEVSSMKIAPSSRGGSGETTVVDVVKKQSLLVLQEEEEESSVELIIHFVGKKELELLLVIWMCFPSLPFSSFVSFDV